MANTTQNELGFQARHIGIDSTTEAKMLKALQLSSVETLMNQAIPEAIRLRGSLQGLPARSEATALEELKEIAKKNQIFKNYIGMGYYDTLTPTVIQRTILENPGWYTQYTPYQAEIAQGRLEALLNFQTMVGDLTGLPIANASLLDEATAAAEAMNMGFNLTERNTSRPFFVSQNTFPQTLTVIQTRAEPLGITVKVQDPEKFDFSQKPFAVLFQYPDAKGDVKTYEALVKKAKDAGAIVIFATDLLALTLLKSPGELGADIALGSAQRFGVPMGFGGPHAAFFSTRDEYKRLIPGRIIGVSKDASGKPAYRLALQTREQHIRREKATSNICTSQVLLAIMSSMYAVYHGPQGLKNIALRIHRQTEALFMALSQAGYSFEQKNFFDTLSVVVSPEQKKKIQTEAIKRKINLRYEGGYVGISLDEATTENDLKDLAEVFSADTKNLKLGEGRISSESKRLSPYLTHPVFNQFHTETEILRYIKRLESRDLSLTHSMIPLGSCTMKLNAASELYPITWAEFSKMHPFAPEEQTKGYLEMISLLSQWLCEITGFAGASLQPNAGSQGEYTGLQVIRKYHQKRGEPQRTVCLIPKSAHGTNPASAMMLGMSVVVVDCDDKGNVDLTDLEKKAKEHSQELAALMVTYPSTHGVFEKEIKTICKIIHDNGGQVYMDGANMNAQVGLCRPGDFGPDVCHLNLHKTFCIPHGGGGPGMGPICVAKQLVPFLPGSPLDQKSGAVSAAQFGSASILPISWMYIRMMGGEGLKRATEMAILNANYIAKRLDAYYPVLYKGDSGWVAHECIVDLRPLKATTGIDVEDVAKRLMDYGFHAPTVSFPVAGTMMIEPTESESLAELDRFCDAMIAIHAEIKEVESGKQDKKDNLLKNAPHTAELLLSDSWNKNYSRARAAFPLPFVKERKFWPFVARIDNVAGDRNLICACPPMEDYV